MRQKPQRRHHLLPLFLITTLFLPLVSSISLSARKVQTTFTLLTNTTRCASSLTHSQISTFRNINPSQPSKTFDGLLWDDLLIGQTPCQTTLINRATQSTFFIPRETSPPGVPPDEAEPFFLEGRDNSRRICETFNASLPATYLFTDDLPTFRERFVRMGFLDPDVAIINARDVVYMFVIPITNQADIVGRVCAYVELDEDVAVSPPAEAPPDMPACFPGDAVVTTPLGDVKMSELAIGDYVTTPYGMERVLSFTHRTNLVSSFVALKAGNVTIELSEDHLIRVNGRMVPAGMVKLGDRLSGYAFNTLVVSGVNEVRKVGLYAPTTPSGVMYVHGVLVSCYTTAFGEIVSHALLGPVRAMNQVVRWDICALVDTMRSLLWR